MTLYSPMIVAWLLIALMNTGLKPENATLAAALYGAGHVAAVIASLVATMTLQLATLRHLEDGTFPIGPALHAALPRLPPFILLVAIYLVLTAATMALLIVPGLFVVPMIFLAPMVWLAERCSIPEAFQRSTTLTRGHRWRILGILAIVTLVAFAINLAALTAKTLPGAGEMLSSEVVLNIVSLVFSLVWTILIAVVYARLTGRA